MTSHSGTVTIKKGNKMTTYYIRGNIIWGKPLPKTAQVRMCGNSVVPIMAKLLVESNFYVDVVEKSA